MASDFRGFRTAQTFGKLQKCLDKGRFKMIVPALPTELSTDPGDRSLRAAALARRNGTGAGSTADALRLLRTRRILPRLHSGRISGEAMNLASAHVAWSGALHGGLAVFGINLMVASSGGAGVC
jgi:hypothetical protein